MKGVKDMNAGSIFRVVYRVGIVAVFIYYTGHLLGGW